MKYSKKIDKKTNKKIRKEILKKWITTLFLIFFGSIILFQQQPSQELTFVRTYEPEHGAAQDRSYLFENEGDNQIYQGELSTETEQNLKQTNTGNINFLINTNEIESIIKDVNNSEEILFTGKIYTGTITTKNPKNCKTPRGQIIQHNDFVLAYEQRKDVNNICNIQKRRCNDGILDGSYTQPSCKEDIIYNYKKTQVITYNTQKLNEYIQPNTPINQGAEFNNEGKINEKQKPTTTRGTTNSPIINKPTTTQTQITSKANCITPRKQTIKHGQFIKAYKTPRGFIDMQCEVEIRACVNGVLKGSFTNPKCAFQAITYNDYLQGGTHKEFTKPTAQDINQSIKEEFTLPKEKGTRSFERIKSIFK